MQRFTPLTPAQVQKAEQNINQRVVVMMTNQYSGMLGRAQMAARNGAIRAAQAPVLAQLSQVHASNVQAFHIINAIGATVSQAEVANLKSTPGVAKVVPDVAVKAPTNPLLAARGNATPAASATTASSPSNPVCSSDPNNPQLDEVPGLVNAPAAWSLKTPDGTAINGSGVKVAFIADNIDPNNAEFIRPDGSNVITDYQDFNGDGPSAPGAAGEAFGDASSIAAQGSQTYDVSQYGVSSPSSPCYVKISGIAPGSSLMALKVFGAVPAYSTIFVRAIQYAVDNGADVLNESFGGNPFPDLGNNTVIPLADEEAVADGVTVTASSGDAGTQGTLGSPSTDQNVIEVGATTAERAEEQVNYPGTGVGTGWLSNQISSFSSGGITADGTRTVDVVAPGNSGWAACTADTGLYGDCSGFSGAPSNIELFGGTSESAPVTAGEAALIIQAYRSTHNGLNPTPAEVKQIIKSTSTDLHLPVQEQGAGLINAQKAVQAAMSIKDSVASPSATGESFMVGGPDSSNPAATQSFAGAPGTSPTFPITVTNSGAHAQTMTIVPLVMSQPSTTNTTVDLTQATPSVDGLGRHIMVMNQTFNVQAGKKYFNAAISWDTAAHPNSIVRMSLYDPSGKFEAYSRPQGAGSGWGNLEVHDPTPGKWTATIWYVNNGLEPSTAQFTVWQATYIHTGLVSPAAAMLAPGASKTFNVTLKTPTTAGDQTVAVQVNGRDYQGHIQSTVVPTILRSYIVATTAAAGNFSGVLTGGNGRPGAPSQTLAYSFQVPSGLKDIDLGIKVADPNYNLQGILIDPSGNPVDVQSNILDQNSSYTPTNYGNTIQTFWRDPTPGTWTFELFIDAYASGAQTALPFTGTLKFNGVSITNNVPNSTSTTIAAGSGKTYTIHVTNTGNETEQYFVDARTTGSIFTGFVSNPQPLPFAYMYFPVAPETSWVGSYAQTQYSTPIDLELEGANGQSPYGGTGVPDVLGQDMGGFAEADYLAPDGSTAPTGFYGSFVTAVGPFADGSALSSSDTATVVGYMQTQGFDDNACASTGDMWALQLGEFQTNTNSFCSAGNYSPSILGPGHADNISVRLTAPSGAASGTVVSGYLYVDTIYFDNQGIGTGNGDELIKIPYTYTVQ
jgi:hypothetical protein